MNFDCIDQSKNQAPFHIGSYQLNGVFDQQDLDKMIDEFIGGPDVIEKIKESIPQHLDLPYDDSSVPTLKNMIYIKAIQDHVLYAQLTKSYLINDLVEELTTINNANVLALLLHSVLSKECIDQFESILDGLDSDANNAQFVKMYFNRYIQEAIALHNIDKKLALYAAIYRLNGSKDVMAGIESMVFLCLLYRWCYRHKYKPIIQDLNILLFDSVIHKVDIDIKLDNDILNLIYDKVIDSDILKLFSKLKAYCDYCPHRKLDKSDNITPNMISEMLAAFSQLGFDLPPNSQDILNTLNRL